MNTQITRNHLIALGIMVFGLFLIIQAVIPDEKNNQDQIEYKKKRNATNLQKL
jgi:hypothetical protein